MAELTVIFVAPAMERESFSVFAQIAAIKGDKATKVISAGGATVPWKSASEDVLDVGYVAANSEVQQVLLNDASVSMAEVINEGRIAPNTFVELAVNCVMKKDAN